MKLNGTQGTYHSVPQNLQTEETDEPKKIPSQESVIENGQNPKTPSPTKEQEEISPEDQKKPMSPLRKFCFVLSLLQCVLFIVAFGWLIPCKIPRHSDGGQCSHDWEYIFYGEDIVTPLAISNTDYKPVAVLYGFTALTNRSVFGIQAINAFDGSPLWKKEMTVLPKDIVCGSFDINSDNIPDCIVTDYSGQMMSISMNDGEVIWYMHSHDARHFLQPIAVSLPALRKPCSGSSIPLIYTAIQDKSGSYFVVIVSGMTGQILSIYNLTECAFMPDNIKWRNIKIEHDENHSPLGLVMSCTNTNGHGVVYTTNTDDLCSNSTFTPYGHVSFKLGFTNPSEYPLLLKPIATDDGNHIVLATHDNKIRILIEDMEEKTQFLGESIVNFSDLSVGQFTNSSVANIAIVGSNVGNNSSRILVFDYTTNQPIAVIPIENGTVSSIFSVHKAFASADGILVKIITKLDEDDSSENANITEHIPLMPVMHYQEKFAILECLESRCLKTIREDNVSVNCVNCETEVYHNKNSAIVVDVDGDGIEELIYFVARSLPSNLSKSVTIKLVRIIDHLNVKSCTSCGC